MAWRTSLPGMIRSIRPTDLLLLARLNGRARANEAYTLRDLFQPRRPLSLAMLLQHWLSLDENRQTWVSAEHREINGLISARHDSMAWEIDRLVVAHDTDPMVVQRLLSYLTAVGGEVGIQKLFLRLQSNSDFVDAARSAGFLLFKDETLFARREPIAARPMLSDPGLRTKVNSDNHALFQLYCAAVPVSVRQAEAMVLAEWQQIYQRGRSTLRCRETVYEREGQAVGWVKTDIRGTAGHLELLVHPDHGDVLDVLLDVGLSQLGNRAPVFCLVAEHEARLAQALGQRGFLPEASFCALVKQLSVRVKQPRLVPVPG